MTARTDDDTAVRCTIDVTAPPERAYAVFTEGLDGWWLRSHHVQTGELARVGVDPHVGGRVWEENDAGEVCDWGNVLTWDPPHTFAFSWRIGTDWGVPAPDAPASRVTVHFMPTDAGTRVELVHDRLDAHGPGWLQLRDSVASRGGWPSLLQQFAGAATEAG
jgi:uncharacterized protein YndB with AHSA1/START domain